RRPLLDRAAMHSAAARPIDENNVPLQAHWKVRELSPAQRQLVAICRPLHGALSLLTVAEPTASSSESETVEVFRIVRELRQKGIGILYITHRLVELAEIADKVTVLRDGETVYHSDFQETSMDEIVHQMVGRKVERIYEREKLTP